MRKKTFTFKASPDLLEKVKDKADSYDLNMGQVIRRLLTAWYHDVIPLPIVREDGDDETAAVYLPVEPHQDKTLPQIAAEQGIQPMTAQRWTEMQADPSPWRSDEEFELFLEFVRRDRGHAPQSKTMEEDRVTRNRTTTEAEDTPQLAPALEFAANASGG